METPLRGTSPRELRLAKFSPPDFPITRWLLGFASVALRAVGTYVERTRYRYRGVSKGVMLDPFRWRSRNQVVPCVLFVKLSSHKKVSAGVGCASPQRFLQELPCKNSADDVHGKKCRRLPPFALNVRQHRGLIKTWENEQSSFSWGHNTKLCFLHSKCGPSAS